jgi:hypothetical protein
MQMEKRGHPKMRLYLMQHGKPVLEEVDPARPLSIKEVGML